MKKGSSCTALDRGLHCSSVKPSKIAGGFTARSWTNPECQVCRRHCCRVVFTIWHIRWSTCYKSAAAYTTREVRVHQPVAMTHLLCPSTVSAARRLGTPCHQYVSPGTSHLCSCALCGTARRQTKSQQFAVRSHWQPTKAKRQPRLA